MRSNTFKKPGIFTVIMLLLVTSSCAVQKETPQRDVAKATQTLPESVKDSLKKPVYDFIRRIVPEVADYFEVEFIPKDGENDVFEIENQNDKIVLRGNNGISIASALNYYLKNYTHSSITWNGSNINVAYPLPKVPEKVRKVSPYKYRYYLNYCTYNYTMSWWDWDRWQWEIDWMALHGINMPLSLTGQNAIHRRVYKSMGLTDEDLSSFFSGPAYFSWFWMGNLDGWGGPLPLSWMESHEKLQKQILKRERGLGMTPILPAFTGHVPPAFKNKFPNAKLNKTDWAGFPDVYLLAPEDPLFLKIGKKFIEEEIKTYGTNHLYTSDTFNENRPPSSDSTFLHNVSRKVYESMASADPKATWIMQGWLFHFQRDFWHQEQIKAMLNAVPDDKMIILDLWSEKNPMWKKTHAYYGKQWIWNMLHNFGGNVNMYGLMDRVATGPSEALHDPEKGKFIGIGLTPEGIEQNPVMYELMTDNAWRKEPIDVTSWLKDYTLQRYGEANENANKAWEILRNTVYADSITSGGAESIIVARPTFNKNAGGVTTKLSYDPAALVLAWKYLMESSAELQNSQGYQFDLVDLTRQVLANYALVIQQRFASDYKAKDLNAFRKDSAAFLKLIEDMDRLLATKKDFSLGKWLNAAKSWGTTPEEKKLYQKNARDLITLWGDKNSKLSEYANRQWSGLLNGYYKPRWEMFFDYVIQQMQKDEEVDQNKISETIKKWEWDWVNSQDEYNDEETGDSVKIAREIYNQYYKRILNCYKNKNQDD